MLAIPGYDAATGGDRALVDGAALIEEPLFWPLHLGASLVDEEAEALAFGPDRDGVERLYAVIADPRHWPVLTVSWGGHAIHAVYRNREGDMGVDYLFSHHDWDRVETLARIDGHFMGPGLSWPELATAAGRGDGGPADPHARLLLLLPLLGDAALPQGAAERLAAALAARTLVDDPDRLARIIAERQGQWTPAEWRTVDGVAVCDGPLSYRNPRNAFALPRNRLDAIGAALR